MSDPVVRLNAALEGRYAIERDLGEGGMVRKVRAIYDQCLTNGAFRSAAAVDALRRPPRRRDR